MNFRDNQQPYAIVIGLDGGMNGIQTARILAGHNVPVIAIARDPLHYCCRTKVCERILFADTKSDAFKFKFGGQVVLFPETYDYVYNPMLRWGYAKIFPKVADWPAMKKVISRLWTQ